MKTYYKTRGYIKHRYCNYCKNFIIMNHSSQMAGICYHHPSCEMFSPPQSPLFYSCACSNFSYSPIKNAYAIPSPSEINDWITAYRIRSRLNYETQMYKIDLNKHD